MSQYQHNSVINILILLISLGSFSTVTQGPTDVSVKQGETASFTCTVDTVDANLLLIWQQGSTWLYVYTGGSGSMVDGVDTNKFSVDEAGNTFTLNIKTDAMTDGNDYSCTSGTAFHARLIVFG